MLVMMEGAKMQRADKWARSAQVTAAIAALGGEKNPKIKKFMPKGLIEEDPGKSPFADAWAQFDAISTHV